MHTTTKISWISRRAAATALVAAAALAAPVTAGASPTHVDGVHAGINQGVLEVQGSNQADDLALRLKAGDTSVIQVDVGDDGVPDFSFARAGVTAIDVNAGNGKDTVRVDDTNGTFTNTIPTTIAGGNGDDVLRGGQGAETFYGGNGDDFVAGGKGNDTAFLGNGDDTFRWDPGEGNDVIEGQSGTDTMLFVGAGVAENVTIGPNGHRLVFFRTPGNVTMDTNGVEAVTYDALGGADNVAIADLAGTDVKQVNLDLAGTLGGAAADGANDSVSVNGTDGDDNVLAAASGSSVDVTGLATAVSIQHPDPTDSLSINTFGGSDSVFTTGLTGVITTFVNGVAV